MSLDTKRAEIRKLEERARQREEALKKSEVSIECSSCTVANDTAVNLAAALVYKIWLLRRCIVGHPA
jgi:hypothetical protein